jgi:hypothetical protein
MEEKFTKEIDIMKKPEISEVKISINQSQSK